MVVLIALNLATRQIFLLQVMVKLVVSVIEIGQVLIQIHSLKNILLTNRFNNKKKIFRVNLINKKLYASIKLLLYKIY